jgi:hypothetical protein
MGYLEMGISQRAWEIAMVIQGQVGYETPIQWRIAAELEQREIMMIGAKVAHSAEDVDAHKQLASLNHSISTIAAGIDKLSRWKPTSRKKMVIMYNSALGFPLPPPAAKWWRYKPINGERINSFGERFAVIWSVMAITYGIINILIAVFSK